MLESDKELQTKLFPFRTILYMGVLLLIAGIVMLAKPSLLMDLLEFDADMALYAGLGITFMGIADIGVGTFMMRQVKNSHNGR